MAKNNTGFQLPSLEELIELNPLTISPETLVIDAISKMNRSRQSGISHNSSENHFVRSSYILISEKSRLLGVLTERDIVKLSATSICLKTVKVSEVMTKNVVTLKKSNFEDIYQIMSILKQHKIRHLPVVDNCQHLIGIISSESICTALNPSNMLKMRSIEDIMSSQVLQASPDSTILNLSQLMAQERQSCVVIVEKKLSQAESLNHGENRQDITSNIPIGIITERDIVKFQLLELDLAQTIAQTVMSSPLICMKPTDSLLEVQQQMKKLRVRRLVVSDESGEFKGIISYQDMVEVFDTSELYRVINTLKQELNQQTHYLKQEIQQRKKSEAMVRENQQTLKLFVRHSPAAIAMVNREMRYLIVSDRWVEDYQLEDQNIIGLTHYEVFPEIPQSWKQDHQDVLTGKVKFLKSEEDSFVRQDGSVEWLRWELRPWHNLEGNIGGLVMLSEVITERKLLEQELHQSEAQMRAVFEGITDLIFKIELESDSIQVLPTKFSSFNFAIAYDILIEQTYLQIFAGAEAEIYRSLVEQILKTQQIYDFEYSLNLGDSVVWFNVHISPISQTTAIWVARDISKRKEMEQSLYAEKELAQVTLKSIGDGVITTDALGKVRYVNPAAEQLTGWKTIEAQCRPLAEIFQIVDHLTREPVANPIDLVLQKNRVSKLVSDTLLISREGTEYAIEDSATLIKNRQGEVIGAVVVFRDVTQSRNLASELSWQATHDPLTGLYNRRKFEQQVDLAITDSQNNNAHHALCYLDLDRFKIVNDTCGHAAGDELLKQITILLKQRIRSSDIFARLGGDEFALLLHQCPIEIAHNIANQLRQLIENFRFAWEDKLFRIGVSIGLVAIDSTTENLTNLLSTADAACYAAKEKGRNCVHLYHKQDIVVAQQRGERQWIEKLNRALEENYCLDALPSEPFGDATQFVGGSHRFCLYAQKIISIEENCAENHYEILLRLIDEKGKIIAPGAFLPAAERYDLMPAIDRWVVTTFLAGYEVYCQLKQEQNQQPPTNLYTINLSGASINNQEFGTFLQKQFERYAIAAETICFEITETVAISNLDNAANLIGQLKKIGCSIALDDFGSGMCSLAYLKNLPVNYLKIDGSFVKNIANDRLDYATVECFHHISQIMNIKTIAEFVEDDVILQNLKQIGVNYAQGYGIERPQPLIFK